MKINPNKINVVKNKPYHTDFIMSDDENMIVKCDYYNNNSFYAYYTTHYIKQDNKKLDDKILDSLSKKISDSFDKPCSMTDLDLKKMESEFLKK